MARVPLPVLEALIGWSNLTTGYFVIGYSTIGGPDVFAPSALSYQWGGDHDDVTAQVSSIEGLRRGRSDSLTDMQGGEQVINLRDPTGDFNPANPDSAIAPWNDRPLRTVKVRGKGPKLVPLTSAGHEITDDIRRQRWEGDGRSAEGSVGIYELRSNLIPDNTNAIDLTYWYLGSLSAMERMGVDPDPAGVVIQHPGPVPWWNGYVVRLNRATAVADRYAIVANAATLTDETTQGMPVSASTRYTLSGWVEILSALVGAGNGFALRVIEWTAGGGVAADHRLTIGKGPLAWARQTYSFTTAGTTARITIRLQFENVSGDVYVGRLQLEKGPMASPVISTVGSSRIRSHPGNSLPYSPGGVQGWVAMRVRMGWPSSLAVFPNQDAQNPRAFASGVYGNDWLGVYLQAAASQVWVFDRRKAGASGTVTMNPGAWATGDYLTIIAAWTANQIKLVAHKYGSAAVNFATAVHTNGGPASLPASLELGAEPGVSRAIDGEVFWVLAGDGTLTDADAQYLEALGHLNIDPDLSDTKLPSTASAEIAWSADDHNAIIPDQWQGLYYGWTDRIDFVPTGRGGLAQVHCVDLYERLKSSKPVIRKTGPTTTGAVLGKILDWIGFDDPLFRSLDAGDPLEDYAANVEAFPEDPQIADGDGLSLVNDLMKACRGVFFQNKDGIAVFYDRLRRQSFQPSGSVGEGMRALTTGSDLSRIINRQRVRRETEPESPWQVAEDLDSIHFYGERAGADISSKLIWTDTIAKEIADSILLVSKTARSPIRPLKISGRTSKLLAAILGGDLQQLWGVDESRTGTTGEFYLEALTLNFPNRAAAEADWILDEKRPPGRYFVMGTSIIGGPDVFA